MVTIKDGDLFSARGLICHQVNCKGNMGRGVAKTFRSLYPIAYNNYLSWCKEAAKDTKQLLGQTLFCIEETGTTCCMFAQDDWHGHNVCNTNYSAFRDCCKAIGQWVDSFHTKTYEVNMPYGIGCGLGGGDWLIVKAILDDEFKDYNLILWKLK